MKTVKVEYTVKDDYVDTNKANINSVMSEIRTLGDVGVHYLVFIKEDGKSFVHLASTRDDEAAQVIPNLETFKKFREGLKDGAESPPVQDDLGLFDSSVDNTEE